jgi:ABC-2 type transport system permease protein
MIIFKAVLLKELRIYFSTPLAYVFLAVVGFLAGLFFYLGLTISNDASLRIMMKNTSVVLLFFLPLLTMRHFAEEERTGTLELLMTTPAPLWSLIIGKWLSTLILCFVLCGLCSIFPLILAYYSDPDWGIIFANTTGLLLCCSAFVAAGTFSSSLSSEPVAAGLLGVLFLLPFWLIERAALFIDDGLFKDIIEGLSFSNQLDPFSKGIIDTSAVLWFLLFTVGCLFLTWRSIESRRWR